MNEIPQRFEGESVPQFEDIRELQAAIRRKFRVGRTSGRF